MTEVTDLIFVEQKPMEGREQKLSPGATIGREGCDVNLMDPEVSRRHAAIRDQGGSLAIEDLGSTNGTFVNGARLSAVQVLRAGDEVRLGNTVWTIRSDAPAAGATSVGQVQPGAPQVTAARPIPSDIELPSAPPAPAPQATTAQPVPVAAAPAPPAAPQPAAPPAPQQPAAPPAAQQPARPAAPSSQPIGRRGDVEQPPEVAPSAIRRVLPQPGTAQPVFQPPGARPGGSAATRVEATVVCMIIVALVAAALVLYFVTY
jgi:predicted component of type VI protein secretion system